MAIRRNARAEAAVTLGPGWRPMVLEPSPPADRTEPYLADDPMADPPGSGTIVTPAVALGADDRISWTELVEREPDLGLFAREHWLADWPRLEPLPATYRATRLALHRVAAYVVSPRRRLANGRIGLRWVRDGFGTPFFPDPDGGDDIQVRVEGCRLVLQQGDEVTETELTTLVDLAAFLGGKVDTKWAADYDIPSTGDKAGPLGIDEAAAAALAAWFGFSFSVLEELRADPASVDASRPQLWPEHFDPAIEVGSDAGRTRASFGMSPGDASSKGNPEPYLYVSTWYPENLPDNPFWNSETFPGAILHYSELLEAEDQRSAALAFLRAGRSLLLDPRS